MADDLFALYAAMADHKNDGLYTPEPISYNTRECILKEGSCTPTIPMPTISTEAELKEALASMRKQYAPFLAELAPKPELKKKVFPVRYFLLDGEPISLPHYGGPACPAVKHYCSEFDLPDFSGEAVYFCCGGADYIATVYVNDRCVGIHEGFFSPFEYEITRYVQLGKNRLEIVLENDYIFRGNNPEEGFMGAQIEGDKLYAATGIGYDDPKLGWHHCPPGMGIYDSVSIEIRNTLHIADVFVRPEVDNNRAEAWIEIENTTYDTLPIAFRLSLYGQNFEETVFENLSVDPYFAGNALPAKHGKQVYKIPLEIPNARLWCSETPWLYQLQVSVVTDTVVRDTAVCTFGMRSFTQDLSSDPKGMFYLNGNPIRLRGGNTMGFEQLDVMRGDFDQLIDDILLTKLCNMNFWRITQRPVQSEVYRYCDKLGLMTQCDFPLFGVMRRTMGCEAMRQAEEMIRLVRNHPCNVILTYINEPWKNARNEPHRHMLRSEMEDLFEIFDKILRYNHPDCVIKHVDGDFDPPTRNTMPDVHCYTLWYNGGQQDFGMLHRGYGQSVAPGWYYGCGEYGAEGLDFPDVMRKHYPPEWITEPFDPGKIIGAQTKDWHGCFMDTPETMEQWSESTQKHQAFAMKVMTEAYRRDPRMISTVVHLLIDAWPAGWMKAIMDFQRRPKQAYFATREAMAPLLLSLRSDRFFYYAGENVGIEAYVCNDTNQPATEGSRVVFELYDGEQMIRHGQINAQYEPCTASYIANACFPAPRVESRREFILKAFLVDSNGQVLSQQEFTFTVFPDVQITENPEVVWITDLEIGTHRIAGEDVEVKPTPHGLQYFLSRKTGHPAVAGFAPGDFRMWYNEKLDRLSPIASRCFSAEGFSPVLISNGDYNPQMIVGEKMFEGKRYIICLADLRMENPPAKHLYRNLSSL